MSQRLLTDLKKKLPYQYAKLINAKASHISIRRVKAVFNGEVTDSKKILEVVTVARQIIRDTERLNTIIKDSARKPKSKKVNS